MASEYHYPLTVEIKYTNNAEWRRCLRHIFQMDSTKYPALVDDIDDESKDELEYDEISSSQALDYIFKKTQYNTLFQCIFEKAAALMFSIDHEIGLTILFSYDYLDVFHACLVLFLETPDLFTETSDVYKALHKKLF